LGEDPGKPEVYFLTWGGPWGNPGMGMDMWMKKDMVAEPSQALNMYQFIQEGKGPQGKP